jgi:hypothetical protein
MPPLKVTCQHCQRVVTIDSEKVPDTPVSYRCPSCQGKVVVDKKKLLSAGAVEAAAAAAPAAPVAPASPPPPAAATAEPPSPSERIQELALPPGESIPPGLLVAEDPELATQLQRVLEPYDCILEVVADGAAARERALTEPPPLLVWVARTVSKPPYGPLDSLASLPPRERRQSFLVLVADNVKTLDGNLAFLYQANLLLNRQHVPQAPGILYSALRYHQRLYRPLLAALGE